jgi:hypothetical protein
VSPPRILRLTVALAAAALAATACLAAACSSSSNKEKAADSGLHDDAEADGGEDGTSDGGGGSPTDVPVYPDAPSMVAPDGCLLPGATCTDSFACCSGSCGEAGCNLPTKPM